MALPADVGVFTLTGGAFTDVTGATALVGLKGTLTPVDGAGRAMNVLHAASGRVIVPIAVPIEIQGDGTWSIGPLPYTDDPALAGPFRYKVAWATPSSSPSPGNKIFEVPTGSGATVDYDLLGSATGTAVVPVAVPLVTSVAGESGAVTSADIATALDTDGTRLSDASLRAAYVPFWEAAETVTAGTVRMAPDGHTIERNADGITGSTYDATEQAAWTVVSGSGAVASVNGQTGAVELAPADVGAEPAISRTSATAGQVPALQDGGSLAFVDAATLSNSTPAALGASATSGTATAASRADHVHAQPAFSALDGYTYAFRTADSSGVPAAPWFSSGNASFGADGRGYTYPAYFSRSLTVQLGMAINTAAAGSTVRLGLYADDATNNRPGALIADLGTIDASTTGTKYTTASTAVTRGVRYWVMAVAQGGVPQGLGPQFPGPFLLDVGAVGPNTNGNAWSYNTIGAGGAVLPGTAGGPTTWGIGPMVFAKIV